MTGNNEIVVRRNFIEKEMMLVKSFVKKNSKMVFILSLFVTLLVVIAISAATIINSKSQDNLAKYEVISEKYRSNSADVKIKNETIKKLIELSESSSFGIAIDLCFYDLGNIYFEDGKFDESAKYFNKFIENVANSNVLKGIAINKMSVSLEESGKIDDALKVLVNYDAKSNKSIVDDQILYNLGRLYQKKGKLVQSKTIFERLIATYSGSLYVVRAKERIFLIDSM